MFCKDAKTKQDKQARKIFLKKAKENGNNATKIAEKQQNRTNKLKG